MGYSSWIHARSSPSEGKAKGSGTYQAVHLLSGGTEENLRTCSELSEKQKQDSTKMRAGNIETHLYVRFANQ